MHSWEVIYDGSEIRNQKEHAGLRYQNIQQKQSISELGSKMAKSRGKRRFIPIFLKSQKCFKQEAYITKTLIVMM